MTPESHLPAEAQTVKSGRHQKTSGKPILRNPRNNH